MSEQVLVQTTTEDPLVLFQKDCQDRQLSTETIRRYRSSVKLYLVYLASRQVTPTTADKHVLHDYVSQRLSQGIDRKTLEKDLSAISALYEYFVFEDYVMKNPVPGVRKRYLRKYKVGTDVDAEHPRKLLTVEEMAKLINSVLNTRDKAILTLLAKTGVRRGELIAMDVNDINWIEQSITLKPFRKRSNRLVFFDAETARLLKRWMNQRDKLTSGPALFVGEKGDRLKRNGVYSMVLKHAQRLGLHDPNSARPGDHFSPHCFRHWFTTHLRRAGMDREFIKALRGDRRREAIDIYDRIDRQELRRAYLAFVPQLGL